MVATHLPLDVFGVTRLESLDWANETMAGLKDIIGLVQVLKYTRQSMFPTGKRESTSETNATRRKGCLTASYCTLTGHAIESLTVCPSEIRVPNPDRQGSDDRQKPRSSPKPTLTFRQWGPVTQPPRHLPSRNPTVIDTSTTHCTSVSLAWWRAD